MDYHEFIERRTQMKSDGGFEPVWMPDFLYDFQLEIVDWAIRSGRGAVFADCGLGKTPMQLVWAENVVRKTNGRVLIVTPLSVSNQTEREAEKFGVDAKVSRDGSLPANIVITNYERIGKFDRNDFVGAVCDESSILKNFAGVRRNEITDFMRKMPYRLLATATAAPNDYIELGTSSEALGEMGFTDILSTFFKKAKQTYTRKDEHRGEFWRFRGHAERDFWRFVCSWSKALRKPSDMGFDDGDFALPPLTVNEHVIKANTLRDGFLFEVPAIGLREQREERRRTIKERCEKVAELVNDTNDPCVCWCHLNDEGNMIAKLIPDAVQVSGADKDEKKVDVFDAFTKGDARVLVTKPTIGGYGMNWQHCAHQTFFPSHSFEQWYQSARRSWRFGQKNEVVIDVVCSGGDEDVMANLMRKQVAADNMFDKLVKLMAQSKQFKTEAYGGSKGSVPSWM